MTRPVEEAVGIIRNVRQVRSVSRSGQSDVTLEFQWGTEMDYAGVDIREKLDVLALPLEAKRPVLLRFHLWLEDVRVEWIRGEPAAEFTREISFLDGRMERLFAVMGAVTALGTQVFGKPGAGAHLDKAALKLDLANEKGRCPRCGEEILPVPT